MIDLLLSGVDAQAKDSHTATGLWVIAAVHELFLACKWDLIVVVIIVFFSFIYLFLQYVSFE